MKLQFDIDGPGRHDIAEAISAFAEAQFESTPVQNVHAGEPASRDGTALAVISLLLAIPGSVLAAMQIAEKLELKRRLDRLLGRLNEDEEKAETRILLTIDGETSLDLRTTSAERLVLLLEAEAKKEER